MDHGERNALSQTYAWNWFALHAGQRLQLVNFWLVAVAFLAAAVTAFTHPLTMIFMTSLPSSCIRFR